MADLLKKSYAFCRRESRKAASNFVISFWLLPKPQRQAMYALYSFFRHTDDLGDDQQHDNSLNLHQWKYEFESALAGKQVENPRLPAVIDTIKRFDIPHQYFFEVLAGVTSDQDPQKFYKIQDLQRYCYRVASAVGLACLHVWGFDSGKSLVPAVQCGYAFQMTNILRDLREDAQIGRVYLPLEDLQNFEVEAEEFLQKKPSDRMIQLIHFQINRIENYFQEAEPTRELVLGDGKKIFEAMFQTYYQLFEQIKKQPEAVFQRRIKVGRWKKMQTLSSLMFSKYFTFQNG